MLIGLEVLLFHVIVFKQLFQLLSQQIS